MSAAFQLETTSDIEALEQIARQTDIHVNTRGKHGGHRWGGGRFGWSIPPNIERAKAAHLVEEPIAATKSAEPEKPVSMIDFFAGAEVSSYSEALPHIRDRVGAVLKIRYEDFDSLCDFPAGLSGKVFGPAKIKRFGIEKFFDALRGAGLRIRPEEDPEQTAKMLARISENYHPRQANQARPFNHSHPSKKLIDSVLGYLANNKQGGLTLLNVRRAPIGRGMQLKHRGKKSEPPRRTNFKPRADAMFVVDEAALCRNAARLYLEGKPTGSHSPNGRRRQRWSTLRPRGGGRDALRYGVNDPIATAG